ncbi:crotonase/enoyl-CoA hydratase family protein [Rhizobiaceae bacterium n13]|uniref:Crotonase/enoyl-CoA hydratase family protein n=1 Tax=Ferirhizobium litorale TaxID=2927786 RepID=A0AAE3U0R1_9HYPH|nr:crotonase/enoyl-CoA hydratase family protein [Fererhizobium litorale]MDI7861465.1 crotonase/enoyl-CoA hydratase family protein [Fererhizobium litorale]MDI7921611.1 crotonase/enoyl-CoA hydratase family protein [Fererhizobium litorale]
MTDHILVERPASHEGVLVIRFNRPEKKNAITRAMYHRMIDAIREADRDASIRAIAFLGTEGCFSAGNDIADFLSHAMDVGNEVPAPFAFLLALAGATKPVVSGVDGLAIGIGTTMHMHCDLTVASSRSLFRTPFVDLALVPEAGSSLIAPNVMGHQRAFAMLVAGEGFSAEQAREAGLIWKVTAPENVEAETLALAASLAAKPPQALGISRDLLRGDRKALVARMHEELDLFLAQLASAEARAAFEAFMRR